MKISGSGIARTGLRAVKARKQLYDAEAAISCLHDALLAVAKDRITPQEVRDYFWSSGLDDAQYIGGVLNFNAEKKTAA